MDGVAGRLPPLPLRSSRSSCLRRVGAGAEIWQVASNGLLPPNIISRGKDLHGKKSASYCETHRKFVPPTFAHAQSYRCSLCTGYVPAKSRDLSWLILTGKKRLLA